MKALHCIDGMHDFPSSSPTYPFSWRSHIYHASGDQFPSEHQVAVEIDYLHIQLWTHRTGPYRISASAWFMGNLKDKTYRQEPREGQAVLGRWNQER